MEQKQQREIPVDKKFVKGLREAYDRAIQNEETEIEYQGAEFLTSYAAYLLEFYEPRIEQLK